MTAHHACTIVRENDDELKYWIEVNRDSIFAGLRQKSAAVVLLFQALAAFPRSRKDGYRRGRRAGKQTSGVPGVVVGERDRRAVPNRKGLPGARDLDTIDSEL